MRSCTCGKNSRNPLKRSCESTSCPCHNHKQPCTRKCRCFNCNNPHRDEARLESPHFLNKGCTCGLTMKKMNPTYMSCSDNERKTKCPCVAKGIGCSSKCYNCANVIQAKNGVYSPCASNTTKKRNRETVSPYKRRKGSSFLTDLEVPITSGPWKDLETICLIVCREVLAMTGVERNSRNLGQIYRFVAECNKVNEMGLSIETKSIAQVAAKMLHLDKNHILD